MHIHVNGQSRVLGSAPSLQELLTLEVGACPQGLAIAVNDEVVPRSTWSKHRLVEGDRVLIVQAVQGG
jgi:sulfur carrier protein